MELLEGVTAYSLHSNGVAVVVPFDAGAGRESQLVANLYGYRDLTLCGEA